MVRLRGRDPLARLCCLDALFCASFFLERTSETRSLCASTINQRVLCGGMYAIFNRWMRDSFDRPPFDYVLGEMHSAADEGRGWLPLTPPFPFLPCMSQLGCSPAAQVARVSCFRGHFLDRKRVKFIGRDSTL